MTGTMNLLTRESEIAKRDEEIATLRAQLQEAIEALKPFAHPDLSEILSGNRSGQESIVYERNEAVLIIRDFRRAAEIVEKVTPA